ncbi:hypothetical protein GCM10009789_24040 [Kribbella sancticallisti]|uniref:Uncharacterized protein n=1 Tax=Kribbella sancticallisti TaxID=460087 RepID=A0ABN2D3J2_9ACTN
MPEPEAPITAVKEPRGKWYVTPRRASTEPALDRYVLLMPSRSRAGGSLGATVGRVGAVLVMVSANPDPDALSLVRERDLR